MANNLTSDIDCAERVLRGMLREEFSPSTLICALHNVLACGKGHKAANITITGDEDNKNFTKMMEGLEKALKSSRKIEG